MKSKFILAGAALCLSASAFAQPTVVTNGQKYVLIHESTGAWCGWCVDGAEVCDKLTALDPHIFAISVHNGDGMTFAIGDAWNSAVTTGFPNGTVDCKKTTYSTSLPAFDRNQMWCSPVDSGGGGGDVKYTNWYKVAQQQISAGAKYDLTVTQSYDQTSKTLTVKVDGKALAALTGTYNINVAVIEDDVTGSGSGYDQHNYLPGYPKYKLSSYYTKPSTITGFHHMRVLRSFLGGTWGTSFTTDPAVGATATKTFTYTVTDPTKIPSMKIVTYLQHANTSSVNDREIINSIQAKMISWNTSAAAGITNTTNFSGVELFPNPAVDVLGVRAYLNAPAETKLMITNSIGQVVYSQTYPAGGSVFAASVPTDNFVAGTYNVTLISNNTTTTQKVVVAK